MKKSSRYYFSGILWVLLYLIITLAPLMIVVWREEVPGRTFWFELSIAFGFIGFTMMVLQFLITARFKRLNAPFGVDILLEYHKLISIVAISLLIAHPVILFIEDPELLALLNIFEAPWRASMAVISILALLAIAVTSLFRVQLNLKYGLWKALHGLFALIALGAAFYHIMGVGYYLAQPWQRGFWFVMLGIALLLLLYIRLIKPLLLKKHSFMVKEVIEEKGNSWTLVFTPDDHEGIKFSPGQFAWLTFGTPLKVEDHPFSFTSSAEKTDEVSLTIKELGDFTSKIGKVKPGETAYLDGPFGVFTPDRMPDAPGFVMIAGGVGITPVISMLKTFADRKEKRPVTLFYGCKNLETATFYEEITQLEKKLNMKLIFVPEEPPANWKGESGFVDEDILRKHLPENRDEMIYYICGPPVMMNMVEDNLLYMGIPLFNIEMEYFNLV